jgi:two-component system, LytTR family, response regulator
MNLLIADDEAAVREQLVGLCERRWDLRVIGEVDSGARAIEAARTLRPDVVFLDAQLPDMSGVAVLRALGAREQLGTILMTANSKDAATAFAAAGVPDYVIKPVTARAFSGSIARARQRLSKHRTAPVPVPNPPRPLSPVAEPSGSRPVFLVGERDHRLYPLDPHTIDYIESDGNYVRYRAANAEYIARETGKHLDTLLSPLGFLRIERSLLVNVRAIAYAEPVGHGTFLFTLNSGARLRSGPSYRESILAVLSLRRRASTHSVTSDARGVQERRLLAEAGGADIEAKATRRLRGATSPAMKRGLD